MMRSFLLIILLFLILSCSGIGCIFRFLTGIPCPGCGLTRAYTALLHLDLSAAFSFHPLFWAVPLVFAAGWLWEKKRTPIWLWCFSLLGASFAGLYLLRILRGDPYLFIDIRQGIIFRFLASIYTLLINKV